MNWDNKLVEGRLDLDWFNSILVLEHVCLVRSRTLFLLKFSLRDDDDEFLYGDSQLKVPADLVVPTPVLPSTGENTSSCTCILLRRVLYPTRLQTKYKFDILAHFLFLACASVSASASASASASVEPDE